MKAAWNSVFGGGEGGGGIGADVQKVISVLLQLTSTVLNKVLIPIAKVALPAIGQTFRGLFTVIRGVVGLITGVLTLDFAKAWDGVKDIFRGAVKGIGGIVGLLLSPIKAVVNAIGDAFAGIPKKIGSAFQSVLKYLVQNMNKVIGLMREAIDLFNKLPGPNIGQIGYITEPGQADLGVNNVGTDSSNSMPEMAEGGVVRGVGSWITGEAGAEVNTRRPDGTVEVQPLTGDHGPVGGGMVAHVIAKDSGVQAILDLLIDRVEFAAPRAT